MDASNTFSTSTQVTGKLFAASYAVPTPDTLTVAVADSVAAYNEAAAKPRTPAFPQDPTAGTINATVSPVAPAVYKWTTGVAISGDVVLSGGPDDVWVFQVGGNLTQAANSHVTLTGGAQAKNVFWQVAGNATLGAGAQLVGNIIAQTGINLQAGATVAGRLLAGTAVAMNSSTVVKP